MTIHLSKHHLVIAVLFTAVVSGSHVAAEQTDFKLTIEPLECVVDITALGSIASSAIAPKECEKVIDIPPSFDTTAPSTTDGTRDTIVFTALDDPVTGNPLQILGLPDVNEPPTVDLTATTQTNPDQALSVIAASVATIAAITTIMTLSTLLFGTTTQAVTGGLVQGLQSVRSWIERIR